MGESHVFPAAEYLGQQLFLLVIYCFFIFNGSKFIAHGCDLLREVYGSGIVGSLLIPVLGAVPDGVIIIFSILGQHESEAALAESISVGVGQLVGATCMLITLPLCVSIFLGSRQLDENGVAMSEYRPISRGSNKLVLRPVAPRKFSLWNNGITALPSTPKSVMWMLVTACTYLFIQIPAVFFHRDQDHGAHREHLYIFFGLVVAIFLFIAYLYTMARDSDNDELVEERRQRGNRFLSWTRANRSLISSLDPITLFNLLDSDRDGYLDAEDIETGFKILGFTDISNSDALAIFNLADQDNNILIDIDEWTAFVREFILTGEKHQNKSEIVKNVAKVAEYNEVFTPIVAQSSPLKFPTAKSSLLSPKTPDSAGISYSYGTSYIDQESHQLWNLQQHGTPQNPSNLDVESQNNQSTYQPLTSTYRVNNTDTLSPAISITRSNQPIPAGNFTPQQPKFMRLESFAGTPSHQSHIPASSSNTAGFNATQSYYNDSNLIPHSSNVSATQNFGQLRRNHLESRTNLFSDYHQVNHGITEETTVIYTDPHRIEEPLEPATKQSPPHIPPEIMTAVLRWYLDTSNNKVALLYIGNKMRWALHLWAKRTGKLGHYSFDNTDGQRVLKLVKLDPHTHLPTHTRSRHRRTQSQINLDLLRDAANTTEVNSHDNTHLHSDPHGNSHDSINCTAYHQNVWENLEIPRWCYASHKIYKWYIQAYAMNKQTANNNNNNLFLKHTTAQSEMQQRTLSKKLSYNENHSDLTGDSSSSSDSESDLEVPNNPIMTKVPPKQDQNQLLLSQDDASLENGLKTPLLLSLYKLADKSGNKALSFKEIDAFAQEWGLYDQHPSITKKVVQVIFYNIDNDYDRSLHVFDFRTFLEEFVKLPSVDHSTTKLHKKHPSKHFQHKKNHKSAEKQPEYSQKQIDEWEDNCEDVNDDMNEKEQKEIEYYCYCCHCQEYLGALEKKHASNDDDDDTLSPQERLRREERWHKIMGYGTLLLGTTLILIFSDPLIEIVTHVGQSSGIPAFYISFVILPFVSNSSELITSLMFAKEKTNTSIALTLSSLYGAAIMNNTFCTAIFLFLLFIKGLPWVYTAEVLTVIFVQIVVGLICARQTLRQAHGVLCALIFPIAVFMIWFLENIVGISDW